MAIGRRPLARRGIALVLVAVAGACAQSDLRHARQSDVPEPVVARAGGELSCRRENGVFLNGSREANRIALSFDLCPTTHAPSFADDVVAYLEDAQVPATFFVSGAWARANPEKLKILTLQPFFEIALHGEEHRHLPSGDTATIAREIDAGRDTLIRLGVHPKPLFRPPYGDAPPELSQVARRAGVLPVLWDVGLGDPDPNRTAEVMERDAFRWVQAGSVLVFHANGRGVATNRTVRDLVPRLRERNYEFVTVGQLAAECGLLPHERTIPGSARR
jgi:peptidoglycan/xylan/chitin deacetylase (PgdA/CDA1 family)